MARTPRPSDVYGSPTVERPPAASPEPPPRRRGPAIAVAVGVVVLLAVAALGGGGALTGSIAPLDVASEDEAVAALGLYLQEQLTLVALETTADILQPPGPDHAAEAIRGHARAVGDSLREARSQRGADARAAAYWSDPAHDGFIHQAGELAELAADMGLLAAVHDTLFAGAGAISPDEGEHALVSRFRASRPVPAPIGRWSDTLLAQLDGQQVAGPAADARAAAQDHWRQAAATLHPPATEALRLYVAALPPDLVEALRGHPVGGPALNRLADQTARIAFPAAAL